MLEDAKNHMLHYLILITILVLGFGSTLYFSRSKSVEYVLSGLTAVSYVLWGIIHHYMEDDLNLKVVIEYALIALLSWVILMSLVLRM